MPSRRAISVAPSFSLETKALHFGRVDRRLATTVHAARVRRGNAFKLTLASEIGFKPRPATR